MEFIREGYKKRIAENGACFIETDFVLFNIDTRFSRIPLEDEFHMQKL